VIALMNKMKLDRLTKASIRYIHVACILLLIAMADYLVFKTGGTKNSYTLLMFIPIMMAAFVLGIKGGLFFALLSGLTLGPLMPENVKLGVMQTPVSWISRIVFYIIIFWFVKSMLCRVKRLTEEIQKRAYINPETGLPNITKFKEDIEEWIERSSYENFTLVGFDYENMEQINRYVEWEIGRKSLQYLLDNASESFYGYPIYSIYLNEFVIVLRNVDVIVGFEKGETFIGKSKEVKYIEGVPVKFTLNCGIVNFPLHAKNSSDILRTLGRTLDQVRNSNSNIAIYDDHLAEESIENYNILVNFSEALREDRLTLNYQPKIDLKRNIVFGVEALLRWKDCDEKNVAIARLIKIIEDAGFVSELTKWVVKKSIEQLTEWHKQGLDISVSVNLSAKDLQDSSLVHYTQKWLEKYGVDPAYLEYELTERTLIENDGKAVNFLNEFKDMGLRISIDDYGTGYNSLMNILKLPLDYIKIDKYFIDNIIDSQGKKLVEDVINLIHNLGKGVCAEGVETKEQVKVLRELGCDYVQGYYYSKAIPPEEVENFVLSINNSEQYA
jgi:EAL domain-containing protein (putative c-di-GMP-specific phosphodiesterase class I)/GGDEF domain-containing protein